jgi:hypothetical protein
MSDAAAPSPGSKTKAVLKIAGGALLAVALTAAFVFRDQLLRASLDPHQPFQTYRPPPAPDYSSRSGWALLPADPARPAAQDGPADVFFVHPTTYNGGEQWNGAIAYQRPARQLSNVMLPNYAGPFAAAGRMFAPRYRQASVYAMASLREDALDARRFAYGDVKAAFDLYLERYNRGRPFILAGVEQGGSLAALLLRDEIARNPSLRGRLAGVYLLQTVVPADEYGPGAQVPACTARSQARCVVAYQPVTEGRIGTARRILNRALAWDASGELSPLGERAPLCVNPLLGAASQAQAPRRDNLGAANATGLEWGARPGYLPHQVSAQCREGLLWVSRPTSPTLKAVGGWAERQKPAGYNLFYADLEADARERVRALALAGGLPAPPITTSISVRRVPVMGH